MKSLVRPELPTAALRSSQATHAAADNSAPFATRPESTYKSGKLFKQPEPLLTLAISTSKAYWQLPILAVAGFAFYNLANKGVFMVAVVAAGVLFARAIVITTAACRQAGIGPRDLLPFAARGSAMVFLGVAAAYAGIELGRMAWPTHSSAFFGGALVGCGVLMTASLICPLLLGEAVIEMLGRFSPSLPAALRGFMRSRSKER